MKENTDNKPLIIFGSGDTTRLAHYLFTLDVNQSIAAFTLDAAYLQGKEFDNKPLVAFEEKSMLYHMYITISYNKMNRLREVKYKTAKVMGNTPVYNISSRYTYLSQFPLGDHCFLYKNNTIQPFIKLGSNIVFSRRNPIGHHIEIEDHNFLTTQVVISDRCHIGPNCIIGSNATLRDGIRIRRETLIGFGSMSMKDTIEKGVYLAPRPVLFNKTSDQI
jgi:acetyltransferase-like isoleucine patch superfamily enzyme